MVDRGSKALTTSFQSPVTLLGTLPPFPRADVTNPRDLYSFISESRRHGNALASVSVNPQAGARLPPLQTEAAEMQLRELQKGNPRYGSYPDLLRLRADQDSDTEQETHIQRSSSLQDLNKVSDLDPRLSNKTLKPILRHKASNNRNSKAEKPEKQGVKFGRKEVRVIKDDPLPPIEGMNFSPFVPGKAQAGGYTSQGAAETRSHTGKVDNQDGAVVLGFSPVHENHVQASHNLGHKRQGQDLSPDIFPRSLPVEVRKPATPTYDDYPEAYWELRSPTVQDPSDLKEDMIDRDRYRLRQISSLKLKAVPRELAANKLDTYRKWHQQMVQSATPTPRGVTATPSAGAALVNPLVHAPTVAVNGISGNMHMGVNGGAGGAASAAGGTNAMYEAVDKSGRENGKLQKLLPVPVHDLAVAVTSISPFAHPGLKKRNSNSISNNHINGAESTNLLTEEEMRQREKLKAAAIAVGEHGLGVKGGTSAKPVKPAVVNLGMETADLHSGTSTSDLYTGARRVVMTTRPVSDKAQSWKQSSYGGPGSRKHPGSTLSSVAGSNCATFGSTYRVPLAPTSPPANSATGRAAPGGSTDSGACKGGSNGNETNGTGKKILKKFNRLQVFSEKAAAANDHVSSQEVGDSGEAALVSPPDKAPYLPQCRPPTYRLDMRNYPPRHSGSGSRELLVVDGGEGGEHDMGGYPVLASDARRGVPMIQSPDKSEATSLNFRFQNGEVIVSRQGKRQLAA